MEFNRAVARKIIEQGNAEDFIKITIDMFYDNECEHGGRSAIYEFPMQDIIFDALDVMTEGDVNGSE